MEGARVAGNVTAGARAALAAGCDMVLICNSPDKADELLSELDQKQDAASKESALRIASLVPQAPAPSWDALQQEPRYRAAKKTALSLGDA